MLRLYSSGVYVNFIHLHNIAFVDAALLFLPSYKRLSSRSVRVKEATSPSVPYDCSVHVTPSHKHRSDTRKLFCMCYIRYEGVPPRSSVSLLRQQDFVYDHIAQARQPARRLSAPRQVIVA